MKKISPIDKWLLWLIVLVLFILSFSLGFAQIINRAYFSGYEKNLAPNTAFSASDSIGFYGSYLSFVGTVILGALALYLTKEANSVSKRLLSIEEARLKPALSIIMLSEVERNKYSPFEILIICVDDNYAKYLKNWELLGDCELELWFLLKNMGEKDILNIKAESLTSTIITQNSAVFGSERTHKVATFCNNNSIEGKHNLPLAITMPNIFVDVDKHQEARLKLNLALIITNYDLEEYLTEFSFEIENAMNAGYLSYYMFNLKASQKPYTRQSET